MARKYSAYDRHTDMPIMIHGTAAECAACMGIKLNSFYRTLMRQRDDGSTSKFEIIVDEDQSDLEEVKTVFVDALTRKWYDVQKHPHDPEWDDLEEFLEWCRQSGYEPYDILRRVNISKPYGPSNCYWQSPAHTPETSNNEAQEFIRRWNKTVNIFRRRCGLPLFTED